MLDRLLKAWQTHSARLRIPAANVCSMAVADSDWRTAMQTPGADGSSLNESSQELASFHVCVAERPATGE